MTGVQTCAFRSVEDKGWVEPKDLREGDELRSPEAGAPINVVSVRATGGADTVHNLTIAGLHNYYVGTSTGANALVHNQQRLAASCNQWNQAINKGQAPRELLRIDLAKIEGEQLHAHLVNGSALNVDGSWKHGNGLSERKRLNG